MAIGRLPALGTFKYGPDANNLVTFTEVWSSKLTGRPVLDGANRIRKWMQWDLEVSGYIAEEAVGVTTDDAFEEMRQLLSTPGGVLQFEDRGFGPLSVNGAGGTKDLNYGPIPKILSWKPVGASKAAAVTWSCTTCVSEDANARTKGLASFNYEIDLSVNDHGLTTITYTGSAEIVQTGQSVQGRFIRQTADQFREEVTPQMPLGFRRQSQKFHTDAGKRVLTWTIIDVQQPYPLPPGLTAASVDHEVGSNLSKGFVSWDHVVSGQLQFPPKTAKSAMLSKILLIVMSRLTQKPNRPLPGEYVLPVGGRTLLLTGIRVKDSIFENRVGFTFTATTIGASINEILRRSGLFTPVPGTDFKQWRTSLEGAGEAWGPRGTAELVLAPGDDEAISVDTPANVRTPKFTPKNLDPKPARPDPPGNPEDIKPEESWIFWQCSAELKVHQGLSVAKPLLTVTQAATVGPALTALDAVAKAVGGNIGGYIKGAGAAVNAITQVVGGATCECIVKGQALRLQHQIAPPRVVKIGDVFVGPKDTDAKLESIDFKPEKKAGAGGVTIYKATWSIRYRLPRVPAGGDTVPANPAIKLAGDAP